MMSPYSNALQNTFAMAANAMNTDQTAPKGADLGPYCLQYGLPKNMKTREQTKIVINGGEKS